MYDQIREDIFFFMFYASVAMLALMACCYLLFRRANAIAPDIKSSARLRRWTAAFFAAIALCHLWYLPTYFLTSSDDMMLGSLIAGLLDSMTVIPLAIVILLTMLQDRRRPLWPVAVMVVPLVAGSAWCVATRSYALLPVLYVYFLLMWLGLIIYIWYARRDNTDAGCATTMPIWSTRKYGRVSWCWPSFWGEYVTNASVFEESCNVFVPWYRQSGMRFASETSKKYGSLDPALAGISYTDIKAALDYYFEKCNNGRPWRRTPITLRYWQVASASTR